MTYIYIALGLAAWFGCGAIAAGFWFATFQRCSPLARKRNFRFHMRFSTDCIELGVIDLVGVFVLGAFKHGWLWPWSAKARKEAGL